MTREPAPETPSPVATRPEDVKVLPAGRKTEPARGADSDILVPPDSAGGR